MWKLVEDSDGHVWLVCNGRWVASFVPDDRLAPRELCEYVVEVLNGALMSGQDEALLCEAMYAREPAARRK